MRDDGTVSIGGCSELAGGRQSVRRVAGRIALVVMVVSLSACASSKAASDGTWRANFFVNSDRVWNAIEVSLTDVNYQVTEKSRFDGTIRAESAAADDGTVIVLDINQVAYTNDQVNVFVRPSFATGGAAANPELLKAAADRFMSILNMKLKS
jgi:hypothetical protein